MSDSRTTSTAAGEDRARTGVIALLAQAETKKLHFQQLLPSEIPWEVFKDTFKLAIQTNPRLLDADRESLWIALQKAAIDGLRPDGREGALVIFADEELDEDGNPVAKKTSGKPKMVVWMPMIRGLIRLARNTGEVTTLRANLIYEGETFTMSDEDGAQNYKHDRRMGLDFDDSDAKVVGAYAVINFKDGTWDFEPMSRRQIDRVRAVSRAKSGKAPWQLWWGEMARKTVLRRLFKRQTLSAIDRVQAALDRDDTLTIEHEGDALTVPGPKLVAQQTTIDPLGDLRRAPKEPAEDPADSSLGAKVDKPKTATAKPAPQKPTEPEPPPFEHFPVDEIGEPLPGDPLTTPQAFAEWFESAASTTTNIEALRENNMDAIADAGAQPPAAQMISEAISMAEKRLAPEIEPQQQPAASQPMAIPKTPGRKPHWPNYLEQAKQVILTIGSEADLAAWRALNRPSYLGSPIEAGVERALRERANAVDPGIDPPAGDADAEWAAESVEKIKLLSYDDAVKWAMGAIPQAKMPRLKADRPELYGAVREAIDNLRTA